MTRLTELVAAARFPAATGRARLVSAVAAGFVLASQVTVPAASLERKARS